MLVDALLRGAVRADAVRIAAVRIEEDEPNVQAGNRFARRLCVSHIAEQSRRAAVFQQLGELVRVQRCVERHYRTSRCNNAQIYRHPSWMIIRHNGQPRSRRESVFADPSSDGFSHPAKLVVGVALDVIMALEFQCHIIWPALGAFEKTVVERGHESCGIYTKRWRM